MANGGARWERGLGDKRHLYIKGLNSKRVTLMNTETTPVLLQKSQVCARLSISARTLEAMVKAETFPPSVRLGKNVYWSEAAVNNWMSRMFGPQAAWRPR